MFVYTASGWLAASSASVATLATFEFVATAGQTVFSGNDVNGVSLSYTTSALMISLNGVALRPGDDFTATNGTSITLTSAASLNDELVVYAFGSFVIADTYSVAAADAQFLPKVNPSYTGTLTGGTGVINFGSGQFYKDASGNLGIGTSSPSSDSLIHIFSASDTARVSVQRNGVSKAWFGQDGSGTAYIYNEANQAIRFYNNSLERARFDTSGNLLVGATATTNAAKSVIGFSSSNNGLYLIDSTGVSGAQFMRFDSTTNTCGQITRVGATSAVLYNTSSDYRLKENPTPLTGALERVAALKPVQWVWKDCNGAVGEGFIAHEVQEIIPSAVTGEKDAVDVDGKPQYQGMDASYLVATLTAAIQEQQVLINTQQAALTALTARIEALEN
jgi:hypothetical protein